jgi:hypothetical protein
MTPRPTLALSLCLAAACSGGYSAAGSPGAAPAPTSPQAPTTPPPVTPAPREGLRLTPGLTRYAVRQNVHIEQDYTGLPPTIDLRYTLYLTALIGTPADSVGWPTTFTVDSVVVDSGSQLPPQIDLGAARGFRISGQLTPTGEFQDSAPSDSAAAANLGNLLPRFRSFFPHLPETGVQPGDHWTDSTSATDVSGGTTITTRSVNVRTATNWENRGTSRVLRIESGATYTFNGSGEQSGAPFTLDGSGQATGLQFLASDGRYVGGEARDSATLTIDLPVQGITIPRRQLARTTISVLPQ